MMRRLLCASALVLLTTWTGDAAAAQAPGPEPYRDPPFTCEVVDYGTAPPEVPGPPQDPLCVRYDKTNITVATLGAVEFLAAEPGRVAIVAGKCSYWQQDHWIVRVTPDTTPLVEWEGSYWYDGRTGTAAGIMRGLRVGGQPADGQAFADALRPLIGDEAADQLASYAAPGGGGGATFGLPQGFGDGVCAQSSAPPEGGSTTTTTVPPAPPDGGSAPAPGAGGSTLPDTGGGPPLVVGVGAVIAALAALAGRHRWS